MNYKVYKRSLTSSALIFALCFSGSGLWSQEAPEKPAAPAPIEAVEPETKPEDEEESKARASFRTRYRSHWFGIRLSGIGGFQSNGTLNSKINELTTTSATEKEAVSQKKTSTWTAGFDVGIEHFLIYIPGAAALGIEGGFQMRWTEGAQAGVGDNSNLKVSKDYFYESFTSRYIYGGLIYNLYSSETFGWNLSAGAGPVTNEFTIRTRRRDTANGTQKATYDFKGEGLGYYTKNTWEWRLASFVSMTVGIQLTIVPELDYQAKTGGKTFSLGLDELSVGSKKASLVAPRQGTKSNSNIDFTNVQLQLGWNFWYW